MAINWDELEKKLLTSKIIKEKLKSEYNVVTTAEVKRKVRGLLNAWKRGKYPDNLWLLEEKIIPNVEKKNPLTGELLRLFVEIIRSREDKFGFEDKPIEVTSLEEEIKEDIEKTTDELAGIIGRVAITRSSPATPYKFHFWLERKPDTHLELGEFVVVLLPDGQRALGIVDEIRAVSDINDVQAHHYTWAFGAPEEEMPTEIPIVREGSANIIYRDDGKTSPFVSSYQIMKSQAQVLEKVFSNMIKEENRVLLGFVKDGYGMLVPVFGDFRYIFGYEGGHVNITGKSGIAGKTSYALFLIASALSFSKKKEKELAFIAFNVKEKDLLSINRFDYQDLKEAVEDLRKRGESQKRKELEDGADMWEKAGEYGVDPVDVFKDPSATVFYTPSTAEMNENPKKGIKIYNYGLQDLLERGIYTFMSLFDPVDINEQMESLLYSIQDDFQDGKTSFNELISEIKRMLKSSKGKKGIEIGSAFHFSPTVQKFLNRLNKIIASSRVINKNLPYGEPIRVDKINSGDLWIVDIKPLRDNEQRMVFFSILSDLQYFLEAKKEGKTKLEKEEDVLDLEDFPSRVCVFVDELNKFAPSSFRATSSIKHFVVDIASRGRSIGLTLLGAEQFASQIEEEVLGNVSTYLIGKTEEFELNNRFYKRVPEGLRQKIPYLTKGELVLVHEMHTTPFTIYFPIPLHRIKD